MSGPKFREGDVIAHHGWSNEWRVSACDGDKIRVAEIGGARTGSFTADYVTLLRRPVRVGDVLTKPTNTSAFGTDDGQYGTTAFTAKALPVRAGIHWTLHNLNLDVYGATHADGTPIDFPDEPKAMPDTLVEAMREVERQTKPGTLATIENARWSALRHGLPARDWTDGMPEDDLRVEARALRQDNARLRDELVPLRDEVARLKRDLADREAELYRKDRENARLKRGGR